MGSTGAIDAYTTTFSDLIIEIRDDDAAFFKQRLIQIPNIVDGNSTQSTCPAWSTNGSSISMSFTDVISGVDNATGLAVDLPLQETLR